MIAGNMKKKVVILGAGLAGLSCAYRLAEEGVKVLVLEKEGTVGGLAASFARDGFTYDLGPHRFFSDNPEVNSFVKELLKDGLATVERKSEIYLQDRFVRYPLEIANIIKRMPRRVLARSLLDFSWARIKGLWDREPAESFEAWVLNHFGRRMYDLFFGHYTEKLLGLDPSRISKDWASERISLPGLLAPLMNAVWKPMRTARTLVSRFSYPEQGGIGRIARELEERISRNGGEFLLDVHVKRIRTDPDTKALESVAFAWNGMEYEEPVAHLMSTVPMTTLVDLIEHEDREQYLPIVSRLKFRSMVIVYVLFDTEKISDNHWIYLSENDYQSNRFSEFGNFSRFNSPRGKTLIAAEITCAYGDAVWSMPEATIQDRVERELRRINLKTIQQAVVLDCFCCKIREAYPIYDLHYRDTVRAVSDYLSAFPNLQFFGRNGLFRYGNMDHAIEMGLNAAEAFLKK